MLEAARLRLLYVLSELPMRSSGSIPLCVYWKGGFRSWYIGYIRLLLEVHNSGHRTPNS
jgi:hypothetical protein